mgnify:CR=1 FL=1
MQESILIGNHLGKIGKIEIFDSTGNYDIKQMTRNGKKI